MCTTKTCVFDLVICTSSAVQLAIPFCQNKWFWIPAIILNKSYTQRKLRTLWKMLDLICLLCWKPISIAIVKIKNYFFFDITFFCRFFIFWKLNILWTRSINLNSNKSLMIYFQKHTFKAGCTSICPYTNRVFFWGSFPRVPKSIGGRGITDPSDKVCVPTSTNSAFAPNFPNSWKTHICHITFIAVVFQTFRVLRSATASACLWVFKPTVLLYYKVNKNLNTCFKNLPF